MGFSFRKDGLHLTGKKQYLLLFLRDLQPNMEQNKEIDNLRGIYPNRDVYFALVVIIILQIYWISKQEQ